MSMIQKLRPGRSEQERIEPPPGFAPRPKPAPLGPHQLGNATLTNVETLTGMTADEIRKTAAALERAAHDEAEGLREFARRIEASGSMANERLANFVNVASTCADASRAMQAAIVDRNEPQPEPPPVEGEPAIAAPIVDLDAIEDKIGGIMSTSGAADHDEA